MTDAPAPSYSLRAGSLISASIRVFFDHPLAFSVAVLAPALATLGLDLLLDGQMDDDAFAGGVMAGIAGNAVIMTLYTLVTFALFAITQVVIVLMTFSAAAGRPVRLGDACTATIPLVGRAMALSLAQMLIFGGLALVFLLLTWLKLPIFVAVVGGLIGFLAIYMMLLVALPAVVAGAGPIDAMKRSRALTSGYRWHIFGSFVGLVGIIIVISAVLGVVFSVLGAAGTGLSALGQNGQDFVSALLAAPLHILTGLVYLRLLDVKEGGDTDKIAEVFE
jgi:hypothetical protein